MTGHKIRFYREMWLIIPVTPSNLEHCVTLVLIKVYCLPIMNDLGAHLSGVFFALFYKGKLLV